VGKRADLPASLQFLTAKELLNFFRRGLREKNITELSIIKSEFDRRGLKLKDKDFFAYRRIIDG
jgi:hypothetical protein